MINNLPSCCKLALLNLIWLSSITPLIAFDHQRLDTFITEQRYSDLIQISLATYASESCDLHCQAEATLTATVAALRMADFASAQFYLRLVDPAVYPLSKLKRLNYAIDIYRMDAGIEQRLANDQVLEDSDRARLETFTSLVGQDRLTSKAMDDVVAYFARHHPEQPEVYESYAAQRTEFYSPTVAGSLALIPGAGFFYLEMYQSAAISLLLTAVMAAATVELAADDKPAGAVAAGMLGSVFYLGGIFSSIDSAYARNDGRLADQREMMTSILLPELSFRF